MWHIVVIYSLCFFSCSEAYSVVRQHQMNGTEDNGELTSLRNTVIGSLISGLFLIITTAISVLCIDIKTKCLNIFPCIKKRRFINKLKQTILDDPPYIWKPLPKCRSPVELSIIRADRKDPNKKWGENKISGDMHVEKIMDSPGAVEVKAFQIFDKGIFEDDGSIILLEGGPGMGKTTLSYSYCKRWKNGRLHKFDMAAFVPLRDIKTDSTKCVTFDDLLLQACGDNEAIKEELKQHVEAGSSLLLVLDGWDEAPDIVRNSQDIFIRMLQCSISSQSKSKILITSRPDFSVDLDVNRAEIVGFTKTSIDDYFKEALHSYLNDEREIEDGCKELKNHLEAYPSIESCCAIPLNAAIVAKLFLNLESDKKPRTLQLPRTRHDLFSSIIAHLINKEQEKHCASLRFISSLKELPDSLKKPLCELAFDTLKEIVIPHDMVDSTYTQLVEHKSVNSNDASFNSATHILPCLRGVLQTVEKRDLGSGGITYYHYFIHLSIQELLAAYHISLLGEDKQVKVFQDLLDKPRFYSVLQFYAAFTRFNKQGVQDIVTKIDLANKKHILLTIMRCCFEANSQDQLLFQKIKQILNGILCIEFAALTPFDCMSVGYFLAFALRTGELLNVTLRHCGIDDHSLGLLLGELSGLTEACPSGGVLQGVTELDISGNKIGDDGIAHLATALHANTTIKTLDISGNDGIAVNGAESLGRALSVNSSLEKLNVSHTSIGDDGVAQFASALQTNTTMKVLYVASCDISDKGAESLAKALSVSSSLEELKVSHTSIGDDGVAQFASALQTNTTMKVLYVASCDISDKGAESLASALTQSSSLEKLDISGNKFGDDGLAHIATALQTNTTMKVLNVSNCCMSCKGAVSLASALTQSSSLEKLDISGNKFGDDGLAHIATVLRTNNTLNSLMFYDGNATDKAALSLAAALTTNTSMEYIHMGWSSIHPDTTLKKVAEYVRKSTLRKLAITMIQPSGESEEEEIEWVQQVEVGGKEFILLLKDNHLKCFSLKVINFNTFINLRSTSILINLRSQVRMSLEGAATSVHMAKKINLQEIKLSIRI